MSAPPSTARRGLRRFTGPRPPRVERCELCAVQLPEEHRHLVDVEQRTLACSCTACTLLFDRPGAGGRFRVVPTRRLTDSSVALDAAAWEALRVPVGMAFFLRNSRLDRLVVLYPSPAGATESDHEPSALDAVLGGSPLAGMLLPDVEALLVRRDGERGECYLVPVDTAYELVGRMRLHWQGFDGGSRARTELDAFFAELATRATDVAGQDVAG
ncbi:DUF5947 family protein [Streptomyces sp. PTM05]|uniref:DUF5947 family protein n=1 Tax=Streptantibioticus parmotrematis TaxID=2873249 RepID=A0ABS7QKT5_9ACTN|nr:DUF5947 family protein [Streptantibioticus parmotrematis]MBY8883381.1 DUF5947 family protein [Streptantibioticus parmotrematis]